MAVSFMHVQLILAWVSAKAANRWIRIAHTGRFLPGKMEWIVLDKPLSDIRKLASRATQVRIQIHGDENTYVESKPDTFPIKDIRNGHNIGYGRAMSKALAAQTWTGTRVDAMTSDHPQRFNLSSVVFFANSNPHGLHWAQWSHGRHDWSTFDFSSPNQYLELYVNPAPTITKVRGNWKPRNALVGERTFEITVGTTHTNSYSSVTSYSESFTAGISGSVGFSFLGNEAEITVSAEYGSQWGKQYSDQIGMAYSKENKQTIKFAEGMFLWQFELAGIDEEGGMSLTLTQDYALTNNKAEPPCCLPGHCTDRRFGCSHCTSQDTVIDKSDARCKVGEPTCPEVKFHFLQSIQQYVDLPELPRGKRERISCGAGFTGHYVVECDAVSLKSKIPGGDTCKKGPDVTSNTTGVVVLSSAFPMQHLASKLIIAAAISSAINQFAFF